MLFLILAYKKSLKLNIKILFYGIVTGILGYLAYYFQTEGLRYTTPTRSAFFTQMFIVFVFAIEFFVLKRIILKHQWFGLVIILFGAYILFLRFDLSFNIFYQNTLRGDFLTIVSALCYALYLILISQIKEDFLNVLLVHFFSISLLALFFLDNLNLDLDQKTIFNIAMLSFLATFLANIFLFNFQPKISSVKGCIIYAMEPVFAFIFSIIITRDTHTFNEYLGSLLIFLGSIYSSLKKSNS